MRSAILEQLNSDGKASPAEWSLWWPRTTINGCIGNHTMLHLQQIYSKISLSGCKAEPIGYWTTGPSAERVPLFLLFLQEIISEGRSFSAEILGRRPRGERNNSEDNGLFERAGR